jgi:hypothetical protein
MSRAKRAAVVIAAAAVLAVSGCKTETPPPGPQPEEDQPGWDCHTMGNHQCGPIDPRA